MTDVILKAFENPDETRHFEKGRFDLVHIGTMTIGRASYEPGWKWSTHVGQAAGEQLCDIGHIGLVMSGRAMVAMKDGKQIELKAGDLFYIAPGHDSWVIGNEPYVSLHFLGATHYAVQRK
jgi:EutQ-like cupin domain